MDTRNIYVYANWKGMDAPLLLGKLSVTITRGKEIFSFEYNADWLRSGFAQNLDPDLGLYSGPQFVRDDKSNFGMFLDSSPDRWGQLLMRRKEAAQARRENRRTKTLLESDYLLGVFDGHRMGALRFKTDPEGNFLNDNKTMACPPWTSLKSLEIACFQLEREDISEDPEYDKWLTMLVAPGSSLGGTRPKASVLDAKNELWIAKFPSGNDIKNVGAWEMVTNQLGLRAGVNMATGLVNQFSSRHHTFLTKRFDRDAVGNRIHFASALTQLSYRDGTNHSHGASYLELAEFLIRNGARVDQDLEELWKRIVFNICISNTDDHLRNHGFILVEDGWILSPAYDVNPDETGSGLSLNISTDDNSLELDLALETAEYFRLSNEKAKKIITQTKLAVQHWHILAKKYGIPAEEQELVSAAFHNAN